MSDELNPRKRGKRTRLREHSTQTQRELGPLGTRVPASAPLYVKCAACAENPDRACAFCTDGYIPTGYDEARLDAEVTRGDKYLLLLKQVFDEAEDSATASLLGPFIEGHLTEIEAARSRSKKNE